MRWHLKLLIAHNFGLWLKIEYWTHILVDCLRNIGVNCFQQNFWWSSRLIQVYRVYFWLGSLSLLTKTLSLVWRYLAAFPVTIWWFGAAHWVKSQYGLTVVHTEECGSHKASCVVRRYPASTMDGNMEAKVGAFQSLRTLTFYHQRVFVRQNINALKLMALFGQHSQKQPKPYRY